MMRWEGEWQPARGCGRGGWGRLQRRSRRRVEARGDCAIATGGMTEEEAMQEAGRCLRCDHFGYGIFKGGRTTQW